MCVGLDSRHAHEKDGHEQGRSGKMGLTGLVVPVTEKWQLQPLPVAINIGEDGEDV